MTTKLRLYDPAPHLTALEDKHAVMPDNCPPPVKVEITNKSVLNTLNDHYREIYDILVAAKQRAIAEGRFTPDGTPIADLPPGIARTAKLERTRFLEILAFEEQGPPRQAIECLAGHHRRAPCQTGDSSGRRANVFESDRVRHALPVPLVADSEQMTSLAKLFCRVPTPLPNAERQFAGIFRFRTDIAKL